MGNLGALTLSCGIVTHFSKWNQILCDFNKADIGV